EAEERRLREAEERRRKEEEERRKALASNPPKAGSNITVTTDDGNLPPIGPEVNKPAKPATTATAPAKTTAAPKPPKPAYDYGLTPEAAALSNSFESNKGKLPWPVEKGFISLGFGPYKHPIAEKVTLDNYGVNISTAPGSNVRASFEGRVAKVFTMDGKQWNVLINH